MIKSHLLYQLSYRSVGRNITDRDAEFSLRISVSNPRVRVFLKQILIGSPED
jgi:hypothetical protein